MSDVDFSNLDFSLIHSGPTDIYIGEMPDSYYCFFTPTILNFARSMPIEDYSLSNIRSNIFCFPFDDVEHARFVPSRLNIDRFLKAVHPYISDDKSYWHCMAGINRSSFMVAAYLTMYRDIPIQKSIELIREKRSPLAINNYVFEKFLLEWLS
jgi:protein-tyrosine phosphatase